MDEIFISYSRADSQFVDKLGRDLEQKGVRVWVDREDIEGGTAWRAAISEAIRQCRAFLIVLSPHSTQSRNVSRELALAESHDRMIIPVIYQDCKIPPGMEYQLAELQWINLNNLSYEAALERLVRALAAQSGGGSEVSAQQIEQRRSDTARLRQILESQVAPASTAPASKPVTSLPRTPSAPRQEPAAKPTGAGSPAQVLMSKPVLVGAACALVLAIAGLALYRSSALRQTADAQVSSALIRPTVETALSAPSPLLTPEPSDTKIEAPRVKPSAPLATPTQTAPRATTTPVTPPATPKPAAPDSPANPIIATVRFNSYFPANCAAREGVKEANRVEFKSEAEARAAGYRLDVRCFPPENNVPVRGNKTTNVFLFPHCPGYKKIPEEAQVEFKNQAEAKAAGYKLDGYCH